ncbi:polysaccharide biosynthesis/export family protein [Cereibacter sediminicola]|uniref:polysaccharide biosynthesis/export family protein n=1 Tax=Cereibacter sediminicola TaxID=2584941 RepID=UPI0016428A8A|nr:polysaccharide biosynthesis/export family protein [Cereibacter sediminicola]
MRLFIFLFLAAIPGTLAAESKNDYRINIGDQIEIDVLDDSEASQKYTVGSDGAIQLPLIGGFRIADLTTDEARTRLHEAFVSSEIYINPTLAVSVAAFRPVFVLGDVRKPGNYDFHPFLTAEQAMGLAGGAMLSYENEEARVLEKRKLSQQLELVKTDLARIAARAARLQAQLKNQEAIEWTLVPQELRSIIRREDFEELKPNEDKIMSLERTNFRVQRSLLANAEVEVEEQLRLLSDRERVQLDALDYDRQDLSRKREMAHGGLITSSALSQLERAAKAGEGQLLQIQEQQSVARRILGEHRREILRLETGRNTDLLTQAQLLQAEKDRKISEFESVTERLDLISQWMNTATNTRNEYRIEYEVRRRNEAKLISLGVTGQTELLPGDQLVVALRPPESSEKTQ